MDDVLGHEHGVHGAERLHALSRDLVERRNAGKILEGIVDLDLLGDAVAADVCDQLLHARLDDKHNVIEAGADRVIDGVLHQDLAIRAETVHLLVAAVTRAHARSHDQKGSAHVNILLRI